MILTQCSGSGIFIAHWHPRTLFALVMVPCDAPFTHVVDHVPLALDVRVFGRGTGQITQILVPCDAWHALVVDHVALALDERVFDQIAIPHGTCALEAHASRIVPLKHALRVDPWAHHTWQM